MSEPRRSPPPPPLKHFTLLAPGGGGGLHPVYSDASLTSLVQVLYLRELRWAGLFPSDFSNLKGAFLHETDKTWFLKLKFLNLIHLEISNKGEFFSIDEPVKSLSFCCRSAGDPGRSGKVRSPSPSKTRPRPPAAPAVGSGSAARVRGPEAQGRGASLRPANRGRGGGRERQGWRGCRAA